MSKKKHMVRGGILNLVLGIIVCASLMLSVLLLTEDYHKRYINHTLGFFTYKDHIASAIASIQANSATFLDAKINRSSEYFITDSIQWVTKPWGLFHWADVHSFIQGNKRTVNAIIGAKGGRDHEQAINLSFSRTRLVLDSESGISGDVTIPYGRLGYEMVNGKPTSGKVRGRLLESSQHLPLINEKRYAYLSDLVASNQASDYISFAGDTTHLATDLPLNLLKIEDCLLTGAYAGRIVIRSLNRITVSPESRLDGVLLISPEVHIKDHVKGNFQAFASKEIVVGDQVELDYPSALVLISEEATSNIRIGNSQLKGVVAALAKGSTGKAKVSLSPQTEIMGELYVQGTVEPAGKIYGTIACDRFRSVVSGGLRDNVLLNVVVDRLALPSYFLFSFLQQDVGTVEVLRWFR